MSSGAREAHVVHATGLQKRYRDVPVVRGLDLTLQPGERYGLLGLNGAGKSTCLKMLLGLTAPSGGSGEVLGLDLLREGWRIRQRAGYVPERQHIYPWMTVSQVLRFTRSFYPTWSDALAEDLLQRFRLDAGRKVKHLSNGMEVKLALLLALSHEPELLILDEPTNGLDPLIREEFLELAGARKAHSLIFSSHVLPDIDAVCEGVGILHQGVLVFSGAKADLLRTTKRICVKLGADDGSFAAPPGVIRFVRAGGQIDLTVRDFSSETLADLAARNTVENMRVVDLTLDEVFKDFVRGDSPGSSLEASASSPIGIRG